MILIAATFVADPIKGSLAFLLQEAGLDDDIRFAPYHQVFQQLLDPGSELGRNIGGIGVVLVRLEDFIRDQEDSQSAIQKIDQVAAELGDALTQFVLLTKQQLVLGILPPSPRVDVDQRAIIDKTGSQLQQRAKLLSGVTLLDARHIAAVAVDHGFDATRDALAHIPYTEHHYAALALALTRRIHAIRIPAHKVLVLDCDNTLWKGVVGEDGIAGISITPPFVALQRFAVALQAQGVLICLASKNVEADVMAVFEQREDMRLKPEHIVAHRVNWLPKASNLRSLAAELNLGLDAFVFLDDNPVECAQMRAELPQVVTLQVPEESQIEALLPHLWTFDKLTVTEEDASRTQMYRENSARNALESSVGDIGQFLAALDLRVDIANPAANEWPRLEQLTQRTNQFNFTTVRMTAQELQAYQASGGQVFRVRVSDRFGDYGLVGAVLAAADGKTLRIDLLLLSCRVLGRGVEHAMLRRIGELARDAGLNTVCLPLVPSPRNEPARAFADSVAGHLAETEDGRTLYRIPVAIACALIHRPGHDPEAVTAARLADGQKSGGNIKVGQAGRSERYMRLAIELTSGPAVLARLADHARRTRTLPNLAAPAETQVETELIALWQELLAVDGIGIDDDYFALGGTSLLSVRLFSEIDRRFHVQLRLTTILAAPTVRSLARLIAPNAAEIPQGLVALRRGGADNLFLVHDGLGETLLYLNLARRLPVSLSVYGIEPNRLPGIPLAHATLQEMAESYVAQIRQIQPKGPYVLGGMCAGGVIAYAMAALLRQKGEAVHHVVILDGALPQTPKRIGRIHEQRVARLRALLRMSRLPVSSALAPSDRPRLDDLHSDRQANPPATSRGTDVMLGIVKKLRNVIAYEISAALSRASVRARFLILQWQMQRRAAWPGWLPSLSVAQIYGELERRYSPPKLADVPVLLVRATRGSAEDTPYREMFLEHDFGWHRVAARLQIVDVAGGHSSMLQAQHVDDLVAALSDAVSPTPRQSARSGDVAVIIVTYRSAQLTIDCLHSLVAERATCPFDIRVIVVDNASGDSTAIAAEIAVQDWSSWVTLITAPRNGGFAYGNNLGMAHALRQGRPDYLHLLNPDTLVKVGAVRALVDFLQANPEVGLAGSRFENKDGSDWPIAFRFPSALGELEAGLSLGPVSRLLSPWVVARVMTKDAQPVDWGAGASIMIRRCVIDLIGGMDENYFLYFEETEFCLRARRAGFSMWYVPQSCVTHIAGQSTKVTERNVGPRRLPAYWFESRRRYFMNTQGLPIALLADLLALVGHTLGRLRLVVQCRRHELVPGYLRDLWHHSCIHPRNRMLPDGRTTLPELD